MGPFDHNLRTVKTSASALVNKPAPKKAPGAKAKAKAAPGKRKAPKSGGGHKKRGKAEPKDG